MIVGDLRFLDLETNRYEVVCAHIDGGEGVLEKFSKWLKLGGILLLRIPDRTSVLEKE
jgi:hypothetical protein